jgi:hypothetical protein
MLVASGSAVMNAILLASAVVPVLIVGLLCWFFFRAARRNDERERAAHAPQPDGRSRTPSSSAQ